MDAGGIEQSDISQREKKKKRQVLHDRHLHVEFYEKSKQNKNRLTETKSKLTTARGVTR